MADLGSRSTCITHEVFVSKVQLRKECWVQLDTKALPSVCRAHHSTPRKVMKEGNRVKGREERISVCAHLQSSRLGCGKCRAKLLGWKTFLKEKQVHDGAGRGSGEGRLDPEFWVLP